MGKSVRQAQEEISSAEFAEWIAFYGIEPFGDEWRQVGRIAAATWGPHLKPNDRPKEEAFMPIQTPKQTSQDWLGMFKTMASKPTTPDVTRGERI